MNEERALRTRSRSSLFALAALLCFAAPASSRAEDVEGRWMLDFDTYERGRFQLTMKRTTGHGNWSNSSSYSLDEFRGLSIPAGRTPAPAHFEMVRDAGTVRFEGQLDETGGSGRFTLTPNPEFESFWRSRGYDSLTLDDYYSFTMHDVSRKFLDDLRSLGYDRVPKDNLVSMRIHRATPEFIRDLQSLGYEHVPVDSLISMRIHGATAELIRDLKSLGYDHIPVD